MNDGAWSPEEYERRMMIETSETGVLPPFAGLCWLCFLPTLRFSPCRNGKTWFSLCKGCGQRSFSATPKPWYAPTALLGPPAARGPGELGAFQARISRLGAAFLEHTCMESVMFGDVSKQQLRAEVACISCAGKASARLDKFGLPYTSADCCSVRVFLRSPQNLQMLCGWSRWLRQPGTMAAWTTAWRSGGETWKSWMQAGRVEAEEEVDTAAQAPGRLEVQR